MRLPVNWEQFLFQLAGRGYRVLLAHPERCAQLGRNLALYERLVAMGVRLQVTWGSFTGQFGRPALKTARFLARQSLIHCLATDSHDHRARSASVVAETAPIIEALVGSANLQVVSRDNPARVVVDRPLKPMSRTDSSPKNGGWQRFWVFRQG